MCILFQQWVNCTSIHIHVYLIILFLCTFGVFVLHLEFPFELWLDRNVSPWCSGSWKFHLTEKSRRYTSLFSTLFQGIRIFCFPCMNKIRINSAEAVVIWPAEGGACLLYDLTIFYTLIKSFACERISDFAAFIGTSLPGSSPFVALLLSAFYVSFFRSCMRPIVCDHKRRPCHQFNAGGGRTANGSEGL